MREGEQLPAEALALVVGRDKELVEIASGGRNASIAAIRPPSSATYRLQPFSISRRSAGAQIGQQNFFAKLSEFVSSLVSTVFNCAG